MTAKTRRALKLASGLATLAGLTVVAVLIASQGFADLGRILLAAGWGIAAVTAVHLFGLAAAGLAWRSAASALWRGPAAAFVWARLVREAVNGLLPVAQVGGNVVGARILTFHGGRAHIVGASVLVDLTLEVFTQVAFTLIGLGLLVAYGGGQMVGWAVAGLALATAAAVAFALAQRWGLFRLLERFLGRMAERFGWPALGSFDNLHDATMAMYRDRRAVAAGALWHMAGWTTGAVEVWLVLYFLGAPVSFADAFIIESLGQVVRSAAFVVPGAFGVQEGGYMVLGMWFGLSPDIALALGLALRLRELAIGLPAMLAWQLAEGRRLVASLDASRSSS